MWQIIKNYLLARWAEPETKTAIAGAISTVGAWWFGKMTLEAMEAAVFASAIIALLPGPISSAIIKQLFGNDTPPVGAVYHHAAKMAVFRGEKH